MKAMFDDDSGRNVINYGILMLLLDRLPHQVPFRF